MTTKTFSQALHQAHLVGGRLKNNPTSETIEKALDALQGILDATDSAAGNIPEDALYSSKYVDSLKSLIAGYQRDHTQLLEQFDRANKYDAELQKNISKAREKIAEYRAELDGAAAKNNALTAEMEERLKDNTRLSMKLDALEKLHSEEIARLTATIDNLKQDSRAEQQTVSIDRPQQVRRFSPFTAQTDIADADEADEAEAMDRSTLLAELEATQEVLKDAQVQLKKRGTHIYQLENRIVYLNRRVERRDMAIAELLKQAGAEPTSLYSFLNSMQRAMNRITGERDDYKAKLNTIRRLLGGQQ